MTTAPCSLCGAPRSPDTYLCALCVEDLTADLRAVAGVLTDLDVALAKQARIELPGGRRSAEIPLPLSLAASDAAADLTVTLRTLTAAAGRPRGGYRRTGLALEAGWLLRHLPRLLADPRAGDYAADLRRSVRSALRVVDRPPVSWYAGVCWAPLDGSDGVAQCPADLYAPSGAAFITCPGCGARHDAAARKTWLLEQVEDRLAGASLIGRAVSGLGADVTPGRIRVWAHRGRIVPHGTDERGRPLYRIGDVLELLRQDLSATAMKRSKSA